MSERLQAFKAATASLTKDTPADEAKTILRNAILLMLDLTPTELEDAFENILEQCSLSKKWVQAFRKEIKELRSKPLPTAPDSNPTPDEEIKALRPLASPLLECPYILERVEEALRCRGMAGQVQEAKLLYLALTSRVMDRPVNVAVKGPSSGGKSFLVERVLELFPETSYYALSAMSERALAYSQEPLVHRHMVIYEAAGLGGDFAQYLMRSLISEGRVCYETVDKTRAGLVPRRIEREGPTGFITTTTRAGLHPENETRLLSFEVNDTPEQTRAVLLAHAEGEKRPPIDLTPFRAMQRIIELEKPQVVVPFAKALALGCDPLAVRLRRDFPAVLTLVKTHAILHAPHREKDSQGRVVAILEDYAAVYDLVADLVSYGTGQKVPENMQETVKAVRTLMAGNSEGVNYTAIGKRLGIDDSSARRRVRNAISKRYLVNRENKPRCAAKIVLGEPMPDGKHVLPHPKSLSDDPSESTADVPTYDDSIENTEGYDWQSGVPTGCLLPTDITLKGSGAEKLEDGKAVGKESAESGANLNHSESQDFQSELAGRQVPRGGGEGKIPVEEEIIRI
jgi:hypothetical protein